ARSEKGCDKRKWEYRVMTLQILFWSIMAVVVLVIVPIAMIWSVVEHLRTPASERKGSGGVSASIGAALLELDRLVARPSVEHHVEVEHSILKRDDDNGDGV